MNKQLRPIQEISLGSVIDKLRALASAGGAKLSTGKDAIVRYGKGLADDMSNFDQNIQRAGSSLRDAGEAYLKGYRFIPQYHANMAHHYGRMALHNLKEPGKLLGGTAAVGGAGYGANELINNSETIKENQVDAAINSQLRPIQEIGLGSIKNAVVGYGKGLADDMVKFGRSVKGIGTSLRDANTMNKLGYSESAIKSLRNARHHARDALYSLKEPGKLLGGTAAVGGAGYGIANRDEIKEKLGDAVDEARYKLDSDYRDQVDAAIDQANWDSTSTLDKLTSDPSRLAGDAWQWMKDNPEYSIPGAGAAALAAGAGAVAFRNKLRSKQ